MPTLPYPLLVVSDIHAHERHARQRVREMEAMITKCNNLWLSQVAHDGERKGTLVITGDLYDRNAPVSVGVTLMLAEWFKRFERVVIVVGNHDTPVRATRTALPDIFRLMDNVTIVRDTEVIDGCLFVPYFASVTAEHLGTFKYVFAHKDIRELNPYCDKEYGVSIHDFPPAQAVFNGHLHYNGAYQTQNGIFILVGAPYPTSWSDDYRKNGFCYLVHEDTYTPYMLRVTADVGAADVGDYDFARERKAKNASSDAEAEDVLAGLRSLRDDDVSIASVMSMVTISDAVKNITNGAIAHAAAKVDGLRF